MQTINKWTLAIVVLCWVAGAKAKRSYASLKRQNLTFTSNPEDYLKENKRQYENKIQYMQDRLDDYRDTYEAQMDTVSQLSKLVNFKIQDVAQRLEFHGDPIKQCVEKYKWELPTIDSVQPNITNCVTTGKPAFVNIVLEADNLKKNLTSWYNNELNSLVDYCKKRNLNSQLCAIRMFSTADLVFATNMKAFDVLLQKSVFTVEDQVREARDCTFDIVNKTTKKIGEVIRLIVNCAQDSLRGGYFHFVLSE